MNEEGTTEIASPLSIEEVAYRTIQEQSVDECSSRLVEEERNIYPLLVLSICSSSGSDPLDTELFIDETIMEVMCLVEKPWEISHHRSSFFPTADHLERLDLELTLREKCDWFSNPFLTKPVFVEGNLSNISATIPINILSNPKVTENLLIGADCSLKEIQVYTALFKEYRIIFTWTYDEMLGTDHPSHLRAIFDRCRKYKIRLNPLKCSFCVIVGRLLGFIISKHWIMVDPLKVEAIR